MTCPVNSTLGVCDVLSETGQGIGDFTEAIRLPLGRFLMYLAIIGAVVGLILGIVYAIKKLSTKYMG